MVLDLCRESAIAGAGSQSISCPAARRAVALDFAISSCRLRDSLTDAGLSLKPTAGAGKLMMRNRTLTFA
jgi:hypothetical protein